jgi:hypothetical protein
MRREDERRAAAADKSPVEGRAEARHHIRKHAILHCRDRAQTVLMRDISRTGMKVQNAFGLFAGDVVRIELLTRRAFDGTVVWSVPPYCGIKFAAPLAEGDPLLATHEPGSKPH